MARWQLKFRVKLDYGGDSDGVAILKMASKVEPRPSKVSYGLSPVNMVYFCVAESPEEAHKEQGRIYDKLANLVDEFRRRHVLEFDSPIKVESGVECA